MFAFCALLSACGNPSGPSKASYEGQWTGTTAQGKTVTFTISPDENVTAITVGHEFNGCSGTQTFSSLSLSIAPQVQCIPAPCSNQLMSYRAFSYQSGNPVEGPATSLNAVFTSAGQGGRTGEFPSVPWLWKRHGCRVERDEAVTNRNRGQTGVRPGQTRVRPRSDQGLTP